MFDVTVFRSCQDELDIKDCVFIVDNLISMLDPSDPRYLKNCENVIDMLKLLISRVKELDPSLDHD